MSLKNSNIIPNKQYRSEHCIYIANMRQAMMYMRNGAVLADILYFDTKNDGLVFVFEKSDLLKELYIKWNNHELN